MKKDVSLKNRRGASHPGLDRSTRQLACSTQSPLTPGGIPEGFEVVSYEVHGFSPVKNEEDKGSVAFAMMEGGYSGTLYVRLALVEQDRVSPREPRVVFFEGQVSPSP